MPVIQGTKKGKGKRKGSRLPKCPAGKSIYMYTYICLCPSTSGDMTAGSQCTEALRWEQVTPAYVTGHRSLPAPHPRFKGQGKNGMLGALHFKPV